MSAILMQEDDQKAKKPIFYASKALVNYQLKYTEIERQCFALVFLIQKFCHFLLGRHTVARVPLNPLKYLLSRPELSEKIGRWAMILQEFDIEISPVTMVKGPRLAEHLA